MKKAQLPLYAELDLDDIKDSAPSGTKRKFTGTSNPRHWTPLLALLRSPLPSLHVQYLSGIDGPNVIDELRQLGLNLPESKIPVLGPDGDVTFVYVCALSVTDVRMVNKWLGKAGGANA